MTYWTVLAVDDRVDWVIFSAKRWVVAKWARAVAAYEVAAISAIKMNGVVRRRIGKCLLESSRIL